MNLLLLLPAAAVIHIFEEFVFPGGFVLWDRNYRRSVAPSVTTTYIIVVNVVLVALCLLPLVLTPVTAIALWLSMASVVFFNAMFHIRGTFRSRAYSPGVLTSCFAYVPLAVYGYWYFVSSEWTSLDQAVASFATGAAFWLLSSLNHKRRTRNAAALPIPPA